MQHTDFRRQLGRAVLAEFFAHQSDADSRSAMYGICRECGKQTKIIYNTIDHACEKSL